MRIIFFTMLRMSPCIEHLQLHTGLRPVSFRLLRSSRKKLSRSAFKRHFQKMSQNKRLRRR